MQRCACMCIWWLEGNFFILVVFYFVFKLNCIYVCICLLVYCVCVLYAHEQMQYHSQKITLGVDSVLSLLHGFQKSNSVCQACPASTFIHWASPLARSTLVLRQGVSLTLELTFPASVARDVPGILLSLYPTHYLGLQICASTPRFCYWCWGCKPRSSCLHSKCFANLAISLSGLKTKQQKAVCRMSITYTTDTSTGQHADDWYKRVEGI